MAKQKIIKTKESCPSCKNSKLMLVTSEDGFGMTEEHEYHCNACGYARDAQDGTIRSEGGNAQFREEWMQRNFGWRR